MRHNGQVTAQRDGNGFHVKITGQRGEQRLYVHDNGEVDGLPGEDDDVVLILVSDTAIRNEGWPSVADNMMHRFKLL